MNWRDREGGSRAGLSRRQAIVSSLASGALCNEALGQTAVPRRIGILFRQNTEAEVTERLGRFATHLSQAGFQVGTSVIIDHRIAEGPPGRFGRLAKELVDLKPDVLLARTTAATRALRDATSTIPIVFWAVTDPIGAGFSSSLARPDQNMTGFVEIEPDLGGKWVSLLREVNPSIRRVLFLHERDSASARYFLPSIQSALQSFGLDLEVVEIRSVDDFEPAIVKCGGDPPGAAIVLSDDIVARNIEVVTRLLLQHRVVSIIDWIYFVQARGALMSYGTEPTPARSIAAHVISLLNGKRIEDIPIRKPTRFILAINLKTAEAMGVSFPITLLAAADIVAQ